MAPPLVSKVVMATREQILDLSRRIAEEFHPEKIILFGSHAYGTPTADSDVDLLVIMPFEGKSIYQAVAIRMKTRPPFALDLIVRTPETVRERVAMGDWFLKEATEKGEVLYESARGWEDTRADSRSAKEQS
jgi:predicted nucleotidyltransferase